VPASYETGTTRSSLARIRKGYFSDVQTDVQDRHSRS
jgi:hypothetical protein